MNDTLLRDLRDVVARMNKEGENAYGAMYSSLLRRCLERIAQSESAEIKIWERPGVFTQEFKDAWLASEGKHSAAAATSAWLIEMPSARWGSGYFWIGVRQYREWGTIDEAVRFSRKEDAERVISSLKDECPYLRLDLEACEHIWSDGQVQRSAITERSNDPATDALDAICKMLGCQSWEYPGQVVRDVKMAVDVLREVQRCGAEGLMIDEHLHNRIERLIGAETKPADSGLPQK